jgi:uncharacterized membrane protein YedE/YeeE
MRGSITIRSPFGRPVMAGIGLGITMILAFYLAGRGIGVTGATTAMAATLQHWLLPRLTESSAYLSQYIAPGTNPLGGWLIYQLAGLLAGSFVAALATGHLRLEVLRGPNIGVPVRLALAFSGGALVGFAARFARGCTSGEALVGGAQLSVGAWVFLICVFAGGFATAWFVRRQWL